jgi:hypothetical protein
VVPAVLQRLLHRVDLASRGKSNGAFVNPQNTQRKMQVTLQITAPITVVTTSARWNTGVDNALKPARCYGGVVRGDGALHDAAR